MCMYVKNIGSFLNYFQVSSLIHLYRWKQCQISPKSPFKMSFEGSFQVMYIFQSATRDAIQGSYPVPAQGNLRFVIDVMKTMAKYFRCTLRPQDPFLSQGTVYSQGAWRGFRTTVSALPGAFSGLMWRCPWELLPLKLAEGVLGCAVRAKPQLPCCAGWAGQLTSHSFSLVNENCKGSVCVAVPAQ